MSSIFTPSTELLQLIHTFLVSVWHSHQEGCAQGKLPAANQNEGLDWPIGISHFGWFLLANQVPHSDLTTGEGLYTRTPQSSSITSADHLWPSLTILWPFSWLPSWLPFSLLPWLLHCPGPSLCWRRSSLWKVHIIFQLHEIYMGILWIGNVAQKVSKIFVKISSHVWLN